MVQPASEARYRKELGSTSRPDRPGRPGQKGSGWLGELERLGRGSTATTYEWPIRQFLDVTHGKLNRTSIARYVADLTTRHTHPATYGRDISAVRSFLTHLMRRRLLAWCPIDQLGLALPGKGQIHSDPAKRTMLTSELEAMWSAAGRVGDVELAVLWVLASTGVRVSELCRARWSDLRLDEVSGRHALHVHSLKGGEPRDVEIVPALFTVLSKLHGSAILGNRDDRPLISHDRGIAYTRSGIHRLLRRVALEAGIDPENRPISALWFRHTTYSLEARARPGGEPGATAYQIRKQAGHKRLETSQHYVDLGRGLLDSPTHLLPAFLLGEGYTPPRS